MAAPAEPGGIVVKAQPPSGDGMSIIKVGGALAAIPRALDRVCAELTRASQDHRLLIVPGGGPFADAVREFERRVGVSSEAAHWMAILAMDQYAHVLAGRIVGAVLVEEPGVVAETVAPGQAAVLAPSRWMRSADVLPHTWEATSDSIAAFVAGALDAARLILIKPTTAATVDPYFSTALPRGMPYSVIGYDRIEQLPQQLSG
jgi:5-(aminomethyl)-3-furanmethanol phosphate kinase